MARKTTAPRAAKIRFASLRSLRWSKVQGFTSTHAQHRQRRLENIVLIKPCPEHTASHTERRKRPWKRAGHTPEARFPQDEPTAPSPLHKTPTPTPPAQKPHPKAGVISQRGPTPTLTRTASFAYDDNNKDITTIHVIFALRTMRPPAPANLPRLQDVRLA